VSDIADLGHRLARLEAKESMATVMAEYLYQVDTGRDRATLGRLFSVDAIWEARGNLAEMGTTIGRDNIVEMLVALPESLAFTAHFVTNPAIDVSPDAARGRGRWAALELMSKTDRSAAELVCIAWYDNDFVREGDRWQLSHVRFEDSLVFPFTEGWHDVRYVSLLSGQRTPFRP
jgi:SnoaL-like domain